ncbi:hypothetical protein PCANC_18926 [Puccinia coronata f. sp. avenae]|uniref:Uncharacterized protein n=1 Tax=Puccinia coronata f. sp. avenae TaxID=200324 RepID=A0A2N5U387_9BASI|nr:hypothetical protein PCANC_18926 [Puccinia coronata f. sp. avenae]
MATGKKHTDFYSRVLNRAKGSKIYITNDLAQKQIYLLFDPVKIKGQTRWLVKDIEPEERHIARARELQVFVKAKPLRSDNPNAQPQEYENAVYEVPNEDHNSEDEVHDSQDKGYDDSQNGHPMRSLTGMIKGLDAQIKKLSQTGHQSGSHVGGKLSKDKVSALRH